jgi:hypothetical protein
VWTAESSEAIEFRRMVSGGSHEPPPFISATPFAYPAAAALATRPD